VPNLIGFDYGFASPNSIFGLPTALANGIFLSGGNAIGDVIQPSVEMQFSDGENVTIFNLNVQEGIDVNVDSESEKNYAFSVVGAGFSGIELPSIAGSQIISGATLTADGKTVQISGDTWIDLNVLFGDDPTTILISDIEGSLLPSDFVFGFRFDKTAAISITELGFSGAVPEPSSWVMLLLGFAGLGYAGYRRASARAVSAHAAA
jgi:PEP-CTERM motif